MKNLSKRLLAVVLTLIMAVSCFAGCSSKGKTLMKIEDTEISVNLYKLYLSRLKGMLCSAYSFGAAAEEDSFWDTVMSKDGMTYNTYYKNSILENTKTYLSAMYEFELRGLKLPKETLDEIDERIEDLINQDAGGSKTNFNSKLAEYGVNYKILREAYIIEEKIELLKDTVYGKDGELIAKSLVNDYYKENYGRYKQVLFPTRDYVYDTDENGDAIYYDKDGKIVYDTNATPKTDSDGNPVYDADNNRIYITVDEDGKSRVAYDKSKGSRRHKTDEKGNALIADFEGAELQAVMDSVAATLEKVKENDFDSFEKIVSDDEPNPNGYYMSKNMSYGSLDVIKEELFDMKVGEIRTVSSEYGIYIIMRYELEEDGYNKKDNSDFFISTSTGNYVFMGDIKNQLMSAYLEQHKSKIIIDEAVLEGVDMKSVKPNFNY